MDTTTHYQLSDLFAQLGLPHTPAEMRAFVVRHRPLPDEMRLAEAPFWTASQAAFLKEQIRQDDGDWALLVDQLSAMLREHPSVDDLASAECKPDASSGGQGTDEPLPSPASARRWADPAEVLDARSDGLGQRHN